MVDCEYRLQFKLFKYLKPLLLNEYKKNLNLNLLPPKNSYRIVKISLKKEGIMEKFLMSAASMVRY